jgi:hypothetical protein
MEKKTSKWLENFFLMAVYLSPPPSSHPPFLPPPIPTINFSQPTNQWKSFNPSYPSFFLQFDEKNFVIKTKKANHSFLLN